MKKRAGVKVKSGVRVATTPGLVPLIRCTHPIPCGHCHYCLNAQFGSEYWAR